jgi:hypothetical protein
MPIPGDGTQNLLLFAGLPVHEETVRDVIFEHVDGDGGADTGREADD